MSDPTVWTVTLDSNGIRLSGQGATPNDAIDDAWREFGLHVSHHAVSTTDDSLEVLERLIGKVRRIAELAEKP